MNNQEYIAYIQKTAPKSKEVRTLLTAFAIGGLICCIGQAFYDIIKTYAVTLAEDEISCIVTIIMVFLGSFLTGLGLYDKIGLHAGAGSIIPITGFANSIVSPAMEFHKEGVVFGLMSKMFVIAGPVIVSGICSSVLVGIIYYISLLF